MSNVLNERMHSPEIPGKHLHAVTARVTDLKYDLLKYELDADDPTMMFYQEQAALKIELDRQKDAYIDGPDAVDINDLTDSFKPEDDMDVGDKIVLKLNELTISDDELERYLDAYAKVDEIVHDSFGGLTGPFDLRWDDSVTENKIVLSSGNYWGEPLYLVLEGNGADIRQHLESADGEELDPCRVFSTEVYANYLEAIDGLAEKVVHLLATKVIPTLEGELDIAA